MLHAVVMAGGSGTRFWPQSRRELPKQLLKLAGSRTMIQSTCERMATDIPPARQWIVTNQLLAKETAAQLPELPRDHILVEPCGRNTAPCIGLAAIRLLHEDPDAVMLVMPADHVIHQTDDFRAAVTTAAGIVSADADALVLFGVPPTYPATGFGYIERGGALPSVSGGFEVKSFREKPDHKTAEQFVDAGSFYWNCGIFVWRADRILHALKSYEPEIHAHLQALSAAIDTDGWNDALAGEFPQMPSISIDYAVLERAEGVCVLEAAFDWDDVGSWEALPRLLGTDDGGNTIDAEFCGVAARNCIVRSTDPNHVVAAAEVDGLIIVHTPDATLVARRDRPENVKALVAELEKRGLAEYL